MSINFVVKVSEVIFNRNKLTSQNDLLLQFILMLTNRKKKEQLISCSFCVYA